MEPQPHGNSTRNGRMLPSLCCRCLGSSTVTAEARRGSAALHTEGECSSLGSPRTGAGAALQLGVTSNLPSRTARGQRGAEDVCNDHQGSHQQSSKTTPETRRKTNQTEIIMQPAAPTQYSRLRVEEEKPSSVRNTRKWPQRELPKMPRHHVFSAGQTCN